MLFSCLFSINQFFIRHPRNVIMQSIINSKCLVRQKSALQTATSCVCHRFVSSVGSDVLTSDTVTAKEKPLKKVTPLKTPRKKRKYDIKRVLDDFNSLNIQALETLEKAETIEHHTLESQPRRNEVNIEMLPQALYQKIFGNDKQTIATSSNLNLAKDHLRQHDLLDKVEPPLPDVDLPLPKLQGHNIEEHFSTIAEQQSLPYRELVNRLVASTIPALPVTWSSQPGWTKYKEGHPPEHVTFPDEDCLVFDIEECMKSGLGPTLATALSPDAWYAWVSQPLADVMSGSPEPEPKTKFTPQDLINMETAPDCTSPLEHSKAKVIVAHNVSFDRARIKEQYWLKCSKTRFVDTMSMHVCVSGVSSFQKCQLVKKATPADELLAMDLEEGDMWREKSSLNNLNDVHKLYCDGVEVDKSTRDLFITGNLTIVSNHFQEAMRYCATDVKATQEVLAKLFPMFLTRFPHPATFAGMLELSVAYLPVTQSWSKYIDASNNCFQEYESRVKHILTRAANQACALLIDDKYKDDPWMWDLDWSVQELKLKKTATKGVSSDWDEEDRDLPGAEKFRYLAAQRPHLPARKPHLPGYPAWYRKLCTPLNKNSDELEETTWRPGPHLISSSMHITPKVMRLTWEGYPLHKVKDHGWGFLIPGRAESVMDANNDVVPPVEKIKQMCPPAPDLDTESQNSHDDLAEMVEKKISKRDFYQSKNGLRQTQTNLYKGAGLPCPDVNIPGVWFQRLPHPGGTHLKVGNPLSKDFVTRLSEGTLKGEGEPGKVLEISNAISYWKNNHSRIESQQVVWLDNDSLPPKTRSAVQRSKNKTEMGAILPQLVIAGTLTRRAVERTWLTAANAEEQRVGSELRAMVHSPPGFHIVGADVDSQELWLAALLGDAAFAGVHGGTAFGWRTLQGRKSNGTDLHSVTAKTAGASRHHAKIMNYARIYGAGMNFAQQLLKRFCPEMSDEQTKKAATNTLNMTKGKRMYAIPVQSFKVLFDKQLITAEPVGDDPRAKIFCTATDNKFGFISETGDILLTKVELDMLRKFTKMNGLHYLASPTSKARPMWHGGTESAMFNRLEEIANAKSPVTPFLQSRLSRALEPSAVGTFNYLTTRVNWVVQSSAVDFLHLMMVNMRWLMGDNPDWRFILSFHDEVRYLVASDRRYEAALALHATNLLTRAFCARRVGIHDLPHSVAFFSGVEVDKAMRKDASSQCKTPSNPLGMAEGYSIPQGETLSVYDALEKAGSNVFLDAKKQKKFSIYEFCGMYEKLQE